ncbi:glycine cleavage T C-terminal barrel domain-containing protein, partial [Sneathiella sp.]|uniref:glycine cleavage T C-terminal barrel domain-containing protein n=1 Tax=Sneathiella sp. TaxID=1964365 RepID=UPI00261D6CFB
PGRMRAVLLTEVGGIARASVVGWCLAPTHFLLTMAASELAIVRNRLEALGAASEKPLRLKLTEVTDEWGGVALMGPKAEALLAASLPMSVMGETLPPMGFRDFTQDELPVRLARISLSVGAGYEIYTRAGYADILWNLLLEKGKAYSLTLAGTAARETLRIEAGRPGPREMNGTATASDLGLAPPERLEGRHRARRQLVGLKPVSHEVEGKAPPPLSVGMILYEGDGTEAAGPGIGEITSACYSPAHDREIALALLSDGRAREGTLIRAATADGRKVIDVKVQAPRVLPRQEIGHG